MDFTNYPKTNIWYGGSERKQGIIIDNQDYMLKFQKVDPFSLKYNHISEFLGSHIFSLLGFKVQDTILGTYQDQQVVACRNFINKDEQFVPFNDVGESSLDQDKDKFQYSYEDINQMLIINKKLTNVEKTIEFFWDMFIVDALIGNFDRHGANWGFIKKDNKYDIAPIFDNGSCLFPSMSDENMMLEIINSKQETERRVFSFPTSQIKLNNNKSSYYELIHSLKYEQCNNALIRIYNIIDLNKIYSLIDSIDQISQIHKDFYKHMLYARYTLILKSSMELLNERNKN